MNVGLAFGDAGLEIEVPDTASVVAPRSPMGAADQMGAITEALRSPVAGPPLRNRVRPGQTLAISVCDITRPQPRRVVVSAVLHELEGITAMDDIVILIATGSHRANTVAEQRAMFGDEIVDSVRIVNHDGSAADSLRWVGTFGDGVPVWLNAEWLSADVRITTGFVEPHFFAGFSGGPKMVAPGLAALETILVLHDARRIGDPMATWGVTDGNPVHDDIRAIAAGTGVTFSLDVVINQRHEVVRAFGGEVLAAHRRAAALVKAVSMQPVEERYDVVITTGSGFPLDQNLYQAVKGMSAAHQIIRAGGTILCAAECRDGFPNHGSYRELLTTAASPAEFLAQIADRPETVQDQWQVQIQARIQATSRVVMHTSYLSDADLEAVHLEQTDDIGAAAGRALRTAGPGARLCVLPQGPQTIPYLASR